MSKTTTVTYYWTAYDTSDWEEPENMVDGSLETFAWVPSQQAEQNNTENTCSGDDLGTITKVEIRGYGYSAANTTAVLTPHFSSIGEDGDPHNWPLTTSEGWSDWIDITADSNVPDWDFEHIAGVWLKINSGEGMEIQVSCAKIEIRVTYEEVAPPTVSPVAGKGLIGHTP